MTKLNATVTYDEGEDELRITLNDPEGIGWVRLIEDLGSRIRVGLDMQSHHLTSIVIPNFSDYLKGEGGPATFAGIGKAE